MRRAEEQELLRTRTFSTLLLTSNLEAEFYTVATKGNTIDQKGNGITGSGNQGATNWWAAR